MASIHGKCQFVVDRMLPISQRFGDFQTFLVGASSLDLCVSIHTQRGFTSFIKNLNFLFHLVLACGPSCWFSISYPALFCSQLGASIQSMSGPIDALVMRHKPDPHTASKKAKLLDAHCTLPAPLSSCQFRDHQIASASAYGSHKSSGAAASLPAFFCSPKSMAPGYLEDIISYWNHNPDLSQGRSQELGVFSYSFCTELGEVVSQFVLVQTTHCLCFQRPPTWHRFLFSTQIQAREKPVPWINP